MRNLNYLFAANLIIWIVFFIYYFSLSRRNSSLQKEIDMLREKIDTREEQSENT